MGKKYRHLNFEDRMFISIRLKDKWSVADIAKELGFTKKTIYNEIKRAKYIHRNSDWTEEERYNPQKAQEDYEWKQSSKGSKLKIGTDFKLALFIENMIVKHKYSPAAVLMYIKQNNLKFATEIKSVNTIYSYIKKNVFYTLTPEYLPRKGKRKKKRIVKQGKRQHGRSIDERPKEINARNEIGHWEMDCVCGKKNNKKTLLVLTERKTRFEIIEVLKTHTLKEVQNALNRIEHRCGEKFSSIFKTITVDNGSEFANQEMLEKSLFKKEKRTEIYYCHPYTSCERGSNENQNKLIRRHFPKGADFDKTITKKAVKQVEEWINSYPRKLFNGRSSKEYFFDEIKIKDCSFYMRI